MSPCPHIPTSIPPSPVLLPVPPSPRPSVRPHIPVPRRDVLSGGLTEQLSLPGSAHHDAVLCALLAGTALDGGREVLLGTYGQVRMGGRKGGRGGGGAPRCWGGCERAGKHGGGGLLLLLLTA